MTGPGDGNALTPTLSRGERGTGRAGQIHGASALCREGTMPTELFWLTLTVALTGLFWVPYILDRIVVRGLVGAMANPRADAAPQSAWADRLMAAHGNAVENLVVFATLVLTAHALGIANPTTAFACALYFWARLVHAVVY